MRLTNRTQDRTDETGRMPEYARVDVRRLPRVFWLDAAVKAALFGLLLFAVLAPDSPQFQGKAMGGRAATYPLAAIVVPAAWWIWGRRRGWRYPYGVDICIVLPFLIDVVGNALDLYDSIDWWDDLNHFLNWGILVAGFGQFLVRFPLGRVNTAGLMIGFGAVTAILWELGEYFTFIRGGPEEATAYTDTLGDLSGGLSGSVLAALLTATLLWRFQKEPGTNRFRS
jgi:hypothetical protein